MLFLVCHFCQQSHTLQKKSCTIFMMQVMAVHTFMFTVLVSIHCCTFYVSLGEPTDIRSYESVAVPTCLGCFSVLLMLVNLAPLERRKKMVLNCLIEKVMKNGVSHLCMLTGRLVSVTQISWHFNYFVSSQGIVYTVAGSQDSLLVRARDSRSKGCKFECQQAMVWEFFPLS